MRRWDIYIKHEVFFFKSLPHFLLEESDDEGAERGDKGREEIVVIEIALADAEESAGADEAAEFA